MNKLYEIKLTYSEILLLDGKVSEEAQKSIDLAKSENCVGFDLPVMNEIIVKSKESGLLKWRFKTIRSCSYCDKKYDWHIHTRNGRHHRKGDKNLDKPIYYHGVAFNEGFVTMQGVGDMCVECFNKHNVLHRLIDYILDNDLKIEIQKNNHKSTKYIKDDILICYTCNKEMQESKMKQVPALMGGSYAAGCPHCGAKSSFMGKSHKSTNQFVMIPYNTDDKQQ